MFYWMALSALRKEGHCFMDFRHLFIWPEEDEDWQLGLTKYTALFHNKFSECLDSDRNHFWGFYSEVPLVLASDYKAVQDISAHSCVLVFSGLWSFGSYYYISPHSILIIILTLYRSDIYSISRSRVSSCWLAYICTL